jgi:TonB-dependent receptor
MEYMKYDAIRKAKGVALLAASGVAIGVSLLAGSALAQTATDTKAEPSNQEIVVTGIRGSLSKALATKRNSQVIVDSISAQDIGALPDRTVSEALQRIPGITLQRTGDVNTLEGSDPGRVPAEGGGVFIRGLSWTRSELNGHDVFSANSGRGLSFEDVSPDLMGSVDVYKTPSADMVEGGIAGIVDLRTRKPLDSKGFLAISADWNYADQRKTGFFSGNAVLSHRWDVDGVEVGLLLSAATGKTGNRTDAVQTGSISTTTLPTAQSGLAAGSTVALPSGLGYRSVEWTQVRHSYDAVLQIRPSSNLLFTFEGLIAKTTPRDIEHAVGINDQNGGFSLDPSFKFNGPGNTLSSGTLTNAQLLFDTRSGQEDKVTREFSGSMMWKPADHWTVNVDIDHVSSHASVYSMTAYDSFGATAAARPTVSFNLAGNTPSLTITPERAPSTIRRSISGPRRWIISRTITLHPGPNGPISAMRWTKAASCRRSSSVCATPARIC